MNIFCALNIMERESRSYYEKALKNGKHIAYLVYIHMISLKATDMGKPLYEKYGFVKMEAEMELYI